MAAWLFTVAGMILVMVALGGATRLTGSGLSIMEWAPFRGTLPPMSDAEWHRLFALYQQIPQYELVNRGFGLAGFKHIFWLEWTHRLWGRLIGIVFLVPLVALWLTGRIERRLIPRLVLLFVLGGLQGAVGWFMVASGFFADSTADPARQRWFVRRWQVSWLTAQHPWPCLPEPAGFSGPPLPKADGPTAHR